MISRSELDKLLSIRATGPTVLSLYLQVPLDPAALRGLSARAGELLAAAQRGHHGDQDDIRVSEEDRRSVRDLLAQHAREWLGHTVAIFVCGQLGVSEVVTAPGGLAERAVLSARPHVRPLLAALQRSPAHVVAVVDRRHSWVFRVAGTQIDTVASQVGESVRSPHFGGWYGLETYRIHERVIQLARHHYRDTAALLERATAPGEQQPLVIGGHEDTIPQFLAILPAGLRDRFAGSFVADPHAITPARVRELAAPIIGRWTELREERLVAQLTELRPGRLAAIGLQACLDAVAQHAVQQLAVPDDGLVPGFCCARCGALTATADGCPDWGAAARAVPDLIEEMVIRTIEDGGEVDAVRDPPGGIAARLRFTLAPDDER